MLNISLASKLEKNKVSSSGAWLVLIEVRIPKTEQKNDSAENTDDSRYNIIRIVHNNEDVEWKSNTYYAFPFELGEINEDGKQLPTIDLKISNVTGIMSKYLEETAGATGSEVILRVVHSEHLDDPIPSVDEIFTIQTVNVDANFATFTLGGETATTLRRPIWIYQKNHCIFKFKDYQCAYRGDAIKCNKTLAMCRELGNEDRYGAEHGLAGGLYDS